MPGNREYFVNHAHNLLTGRAKARTWCRTCSGFPSTGWLRNLDSSDGRALGEASMKCRGLTSVLAMLAVTVLAGCSGTEVVSRSPEGIAIAADAESDMERASREATRYCDETGRRAVLDRTEAVGEGAVAYFDCR